MHNLFVVNDEKKLADLAATVLKARTSARVRDEALDALRGANPGLDFDRLTPGTVILVPPVPGVRTAPSADPVRAAADDLIVRVDEGIGSLAASIEEAESDRGVQKEETQRLFQTALIKRLVADEPRLASNIDSVRAGFKEDDAAAKTAQSDLGRARESWAADLEALRGLL